MRKFSVRELCLAAMVAALYFVLSYFANIFGLTFGPVQFRFSEALTVLPFFFPTAVPGLFVGCLITNILSPYGIMDVIVGPLATLIAALWTGRVRDRRLAPLPPVLCNAVLVGFTIGFAEAGGLTGAFPAAWAYNALTVGLGELGVCYLLGMGLLSLLPRLSFFRNIIPPERAERCLKAQAPSLRSK